MQINYNIVSCRQELHVSLIPQGYHSQQSIHHAQAITQRLGGGPPYNVAIFPRLECS